MFLTRSEYITHWESCHVPDMAAMSTFSATQLHTRIHMGHVAYVLALAHRMKGAEAPSEPAVCDRSLIRFGITEYSDILSDFLGPLNLEEFEAVCNDMLGPSGESATLQENGSNG